MRTRDMMQPAGPRRADGDRRYFECLQQRFSGICSAAAPLLLADSLNPRLECAKGVSSWAKVRRPGV